MFKSLRNRLILWFLLMAFTIGCVIFPLNYYHKKNEAKLHNSVYSLNDLHILLLKDLKVTNEFLSNENTNPNFFVTGESPYLFKHQEISDSIRKLLVCYPESSNINILSIRQIDNLYSYYCNIIDSLIYTIYKRGYRDFGLEGEMISYIFQLEKNTKIAPYISEIRKNEREYLNRNDSAYVLALNKLVNSLILDITFSKRFSIEEKSSLISLLKDYRYSFNKLVAFDSKIGLKSNTGYKSELNITGDSIDNSINSILQNALKTEQVQLARLNLLFGLLSLLLIIAAILSSLFVSRRLVSHLEQLTQYISEIAENDFNHTLKFSLRNSSTEIRKIYKEFRNMVAQLKIRENQRDRALIAANENEFRYRELAELLPQSIFETDKLGNLVYVNKSWYKDFGYTNDDFKQGINLIEILITNTTQKLFETDKIENSDYLAIRKDKTKFPATVYADTIIKDGKYIGRRGIIIDSTLRNKYVETLKNETIKAITSDKYKSSFLANMSHEIRTPMNSIIGFANLLSSPHIPEEQKNQFVQFIQSSGQILLNLIDDIIDIAKIEAGEIKLKYSSCNPAKIIDELSYTFEGYKLSLGKDYIKLLTQIPENQIIFKTDGFRLQQILTNLISNAIKFTENGTVTIGLEIVAERVVRFIVEDTGVGLTKEELKTIFERFKRTKNSENKNITGTGLGLSISKNLVELLGGQMWVNSEPGVGTKFWFELPYIRIPETTENISSSSPDLKNDSLNWSDLTFIVAEDDDASYTLLKEILIKTGVRLVRAINGKEVVEAVKFSEDIDLILMDIQMPFQNGFESARQIKELRPGLPIIAQTAYAMEGDKEKSILSGCDDYIAKPIQPDKLLSKIAQFIDSTDKKNSPEVSSGIVNSQMKKILNNNK
jgi:PAS domain S-box-containing protein